MFYLIVVTAVLPDICLHRTHVTRSGRLNDRHSTAHPQTRRCVTIQQHGAEQGEAT